MRALRASQLCQRMESALKSGQWREAIDLGEKVLNSLPHHIWAQCLLGQAYLAQGWEDQAQACFHSILERDPECAAARMGLALQLELRAGVGEKSPPPHSSSLVNYQPDLTRHPELETDKVGTRNSNHCERAEALWRLGSLQEAAMEARQALQMSPQSLKAILLLADIAWQRGDLEEFAEWLHQAQRLDPGGVVARRIWGDQHPLLYVLRVNPLLPIEEAGLQLPTDCLSPRQSEGERTKDKADCQQTVPVCVNRHAKECQAPRQVAGHLVGWSPDRIRRPPDQQASKSTDQFDNPPWLLGSSLPRSPRPTDQQTNTPLQAAPPRGSSEGLGSQPQVQEDGELAEIELELKRIASSLSADWGSPIDRVDSALSPSEPQLLPRAAPVRRRRPTRCLEAPLGLIVSNRTMLEAKYGSAGASHIHQALTELADAMSDGGSACRGSAGRRRMQALVLYLDDQQALQPYGLAPADPKDPQELKLILNRLEERLADERGGGEQAVTYLLLIGGDDIVPFYPLPDPNKDEDEFVLSDHPYACLGDNYLSFPSTSERVVGRLPDGASGDIGFLLKLITSATEAHRSLHRRSSFWQALGGWLGQARGDGRVTSLGYTASIWRRAAREVFSSIGQKNLLRTSPPLTCEEMPSLGPIAPRFSYFNLHGLRDSAYWYGQRDPTYAAGYPLFPVAIKPDNIPVVPHPETIVFSEACYGAHILNKHQMSSLALRFLATQALGVVGSTAIAYGAIDPPLMGADLLAKAFWERVKAGYPLGEALRQAKQALAQEMLARQGYLDPEDQKTILSFVLYGDPTLVMVCPVARHGETGSGNEVLKLSSLLWKRIKEARSHEAAFRETGAGPLTSLRTSSDCPSPSTGDKLLAAALCRRRVLETRLISPELMTHVQHRLASYLPSSMWKDVIVSVQTLDDEKRFNEQCEPHSHRSIHQSVAPGLSSHASRLTHNVGHIPAQAKLVFTLQQKSSTPEDNADNIGVHHQIVKVTVDSQGNLVKIAISR